ncbi:MAG: hypothetical protein HYS07_06445 [Chlamydiae bacterium]|nr:hypothetical protein [Chlamydiota bacterium]MBI3276561.1 hypothetical protein [Chlamydiota bacterium]
MAHPIKKELLKIIKKLGPKECATLLDFAFFLKTRHERDPDQAYFWTKRWQEMERQVGLDKAKGRIIGVER